MKKHLLLLSFIGMAYVNVQAQDSTKVVDSDLKSYNRWTIEFNAGQSKGIKPYHEGYFFSNPNKHLSVDFNHFDLGARYMISPKFGVKLDVAYDLLENQKGSGSKQFEMQHIRLGMQGVVNAVRLFSFEERAGRFGLLFHGGFQGAAMTPKSNEGIPESDVPNSPQNINITEYNVGIMFGFTPQVRITKAIGLQADFTMNSNVRQHFNWDGSYSEPSNNLAGSLYTVSLGFSYSFGKDDIHGDWAIIESDASEEMKALDERIGELETMMNDTDKDGVPDYLDVENNSIAGASVDTKGRMVDLNKNGIPDEFEKYVNSSVTTANEKNNSGEVVKRLINEGYVSVFFDFNSSKPTPSSTQNISFIQTYLKQNPDSTVQITGYADEIGSSEFNKALSEKRANAVKTTLTNAGISASRVNIIPAGEDTSVDKDSDSARKLVRRVLFKVE